MLVIKTLTVEFPLKLFHLEFKPQLNNFSYKIVHNSNTLKTEQKTTRELGKWFQFPEAQPEHPVFP